MPTKLELETLENLRHDLRASLLGVLGLAEALHKGLKNTATATQSDALVSAIFACLDFQTQMLDKLIENKSIKNLRHGMPKISDGKENGYFFKGSLDPVLKHGDCASPSVQNIFCLKKVIKKAIDLVRPRALLKNLNLDFEWNTVLPTDVVGDELSFFRIMHELLTNAIKFTDEGKITIRFDLQDKQNHQFILCGEISDTGKGIADDEKAAVFQRFYRIPSNESGSGIGLSQVQHMIHALNGKCEIKSMIGQGTGFFFHIPMIEADAVQTNLIEDHFITETVMHQLLLQHLPKDCLKIEQALQKKEWQKLHDANHTLLGALLYCDAPRLKSASVELQKALQHDNTSKIIQCAKNLLMEMGNLIACKA